MIFSKRKNFTCCLLLAMMVFAVGIHPGSAQTPAENFRFVVMGDNRPHWDADDSITQPEEFKENIRAINLLDPDFVIDVGDLIRGYTDSAELLQKEWDDFDRTIKSFEMPFDLVVGNHDVRDELSQQIYLQRYGRLYYSFNFGNSHFVVLDSDEAGSIDFIRGEQLTWLQKDLNDHQNARHTFVFLHKPLWAYKNNDWMTVVHPVLANHGVTAVFAGHWHVYQQFPAVDGMGYFVTGGGGAELDTPEALGGFFHFMQGSVRGDEVNYAVVKPGGVKLIDVVTAEMVAKAEELQRQLVPRLSVTSPGNFAQSITIPIANPFPYPVSAKFTWSLPENSAWRANPCAIEFALDKSESSSLLINLKGNGSRVFPLPELRYKIYRGNELLIDDGVRVDLANDWFVRDWMVIGPFDLKMQKGVPLGFDEVYPPEKKIELQKSYESTGKKIGWKPATAETDGLVNLDKLFEPNDRVLAYVLCYVEAPTEMESTISLGSDHGAKMWLNDKLIFARHVPRSARPDQDVIPVTLKKGWNTVLLKVEDLGGDWGFYLRFSNPANLLKYQSQLSE